MSSDSEWFLVSDGRENADLRREFARYKVDRSRDASSLKKNLLELAQADPLNASPWIRLGVLALGNGTAEEIRGYYDRAIEVLAQREQKFATEGREDVVTAIQRERDVIRAVRDVVPRYVANRSTLILHPDLEGGRHYVLRERTTSRVLEILAPKRNEGSGAATLHSKKMTFERCAFIVALSLLAVPARPSSLTPGRRASCRGRQKQ